MKAIYHQRGIRYFDFISTSCFPTQCGSSTPLELFLSAHIPQSAIRRLLCGAPDIQLWCTMKGEILPGGRTRRGPR